MTNSWSGSFTAKSPGAATPGFGGGLRWGPWCFLYGAFWGGFFEGACKNGTSSAYRRYELDLRQGWGGTGAFLSAASPLG
jgi:hypothetical protein